jgi:aminoglycoside phosphotransferase family enzyme
MGRHAGRTASPSLEDKVAFLRQPGSYPEAPRQVTAVETHMSWVFLTDAFAYKLKKPVRYDFLDFSTLDARRLDCEAELLLNRRLAADVYLAVEPLLQAEDGRLFLHGKGRVVDWLVKMRRLPAGRMLDSLIRQRKVPQDAMCSLARKFAAFYGGVVPEPIDAASYRQRLAEQIAESLHELSRPEFGLPADHLARLAATQSAFVQEQAAMLDARVAQRRIVEGHGDLRPEHVCLLPDPIVIDCLEFKRDFRIIDPLDELGGYLALECERLGAPEVGTWLLTAYSAASGDHWPVPLLHFYQSCRALLRAKLTIWHLRDDGCAEPQKWVGVAHEYLGLAERHIALARC